MKVKISWKRIFAIALVVSMVLQMFPTSMLEMKAADTSDVTANGTEYTNSTTDIKFQFYDDISQYRGTTKTYPTKEGYVFAGWYTGVTEAASDEEATPISGNATGGSAWAKFVPEEVLSVKAQVSRNITTLSTGETVKLRLVTAVDSLKYSEVGFKIRFNGSETENTYGSKDVYKKIEVVDGYGRNWTTTPSDEFHKSATWFATVKITGISEQYFTSYEFAVTPYWITEDGTTVTGVSRERILVSDDLMTYSDGSSTGEKADFTRQDHTYTFANEASGTNVSYQYFEKGSHTAYLKGTYTPSGKNEKFGISIRNGGETRQVLFSNAGVLVVKDAVHATGFANGTTAYDAYDDVACKDGLYVWATKAVKGSNNVYTATTSAICTMLNGTSATEVIWAIENNVLYCSVAGQVVLRLPMQLLCDKWQSGRYYQLGLAAYNEDANTTESRMTFQCEKLLFGKDALNVLVPETVKTHTVYCMAYEPITGSYMPAGVAGPAHAYGVSGDKSTPMSMRADLKWQDVTNSNSGAGFTIQFGNETRQIYFEYSGNSSYIIRKQSGHAWESVEQIESKFYANPYADLTNCKMEVYVYDEKVSVLINGKTAFESLLSSTELFGSAYTGDATISLGIATWDGYNGQSLFRNVTFETGADVVTEKMKNWTFYPQAKGNNISVNTDTGYASKTAAGYEQLKFTDLSDAWQISGTMSHSGVNLQGFWITDGTGSKYVRILGQNKGFGYVPGWKWDYNGSGTSDYNFQPYDGYFNKDGEASVSFQAVIAHDTLYVWLNDVFSWMIPLTDSKFGGFSANTKYQIQLDFGETNVKTSFENLKVRSGSEVDARLVSTLKSANDFDWLAANKMMTLTPKGEFLALNSESGGDRTISAKTKSDTIYMKASWEKLNDDKKSEYTGITLEGSDGKNRQIRFQNQGIVVMANHEWQGRNESISEIFTYNTNDQSNPYVWGTENGSPIQEMLQSKAGTKYQIIWVLRDNTLFCSVNGVTCVAIPLNKLCSTWTGGSGIAYKIGLSHWDVNQNSMVHVSDMELLYGSDAEAKLVQNSVAPSSNTGMVYDPVRGAYMPYKLKECARLYGAKATTAAVEAEIQWIDSNNAKGGVGITVVSGSHSMQLYTQGLNSEVRIQKDYGWTNPKIVITDKLMPGVLPFDSKNLCKVKAVVQDDRLYVMFNGESAYEVALADYITDYTSGSEVQIGIATWDAHIGPSVFKNVRFTSGDAAAQLLKANWNFYTTSHSDYANVTTGGNVYKKAVKGAATVQLSGQSAAWEITGIMKQEDLTKRLDQGIKIVCGDKWLTLFGQHYGVVANTHNRSWNDSWKYNQKSDFIAVDDANYHEFFKEPKTGDLRTKKEIAFKIKIVDDVVYGWFDNVLIWKVQLTDTYFGGFASGSVYQVSLETNDQAIAASYENVQVLKGKQVGPEISVADISGNP